MTENPGSAGPGIYLRTYDIRIKKKYGIAAAGVHEEIRRYCAHNQEKVIEDVKMGGKYYCYTSAQRIGKHLSYTKVTVERALKKLCAAGLIQKESRWGTKVHSKNPNALLYFAEEYGCCAQANSPNAYDQNDGTPYDQNDGTERRKVEAKQKSAVLKDQTTSARTRSKEAAVSCERGKSKPTTKTKNYTRSADGPQPIGQAIARAIDGQPSIRKNLSYESHGRSGPVERKLSGAQIRENEEAEKKAAAISAAEEEKRMVEGLRELVTTLLDRRVVPKDFRKTIEAALLEEYNPFYDGWDIDVLRVWVEQLKAMPTKPKPQPLAETVAEAPGGAAG